ncbi:MAG: cupin domain-containing protein [Thermoleophilia bacterium]
MSGDAGPPVPEAPLERTDAGLVPAGAGWFVLNARDARWVHRPGMGHGLPLTGWTAQEAETWFPMLGVAIRVFGPGEPSTVPHWEADAEDFRVLHGEAVLIIEGQERRLRRWDFVHCPPGTRHAFAGAGDGPCVLLCASSRVHQAGDRWGAYEDDPAARRHGAAPPRDTDDSREAYAAFPPAAPVPYPGGLLPEDGAP